MTSTRKAVSVDENELFRLLVQSVQDYALFVLDPEGRILTWNSGAQALKGYAREEIIGKHFSVFYLPDAIQSGWPDHELVLAEKEGRFSDEGWRVKKDGTSFWASVVITALRDQEGRLAGFAKVTRDMTERRQNEERIRELNRELRDRVEQLDEARRTVELRTIELQHLSGRLMHVQDEERRRISRELHDDLGQRLSAIKMSTDAIRKNDVSQQIDDVIGIVRNLSYLLHPPLLDETGLRAALYWLIDGLSKRSKIQISFTARPTNFPRLSSDIETAIFRIVQESLNNIYRHSGSDQARVDLEKVEESVIVRVRDFGKGLNTDGEPLRARMGVGISGMRERVRQFGGELTITSAEPGTQIEARIPLF
jgi:PAS domain S-box-containing protein